MDCCLFLVFVIILLVSIFIPVVFYVLVITSTVVLLVVIYVLLSRETETIKCYRKFGLVVIGAFAWLGFASLHYGYTKATGFICTMHLTFSAIVAMGLALSYMAIIFRILPREYNNVYKYLKDKDAILPDMEEVD